MEKLLFLAAPLIWLFFRSKTFRRWVYGYAILYGLVCISYWFFPIIVLSVALLLIASA
jgi:dolichol kinase